MTARDIQRSVIVQLYRRTFCMPNYTPKSWWECDIFQVTQAGFFYEYEIKLTLSDFKADAKKERAVIVDTTPDKWRVEKHNKHQRLGQPEGPVCFYYVAPAGLLNASLIPEWAGQIVVSPNAYGRYHHFHIEKKAPRLHSQKVDPVVKKHAESVAYWRFLNMFLKPHEQPIPSVGPDNAGPVRL
jgi:hypothetical protein